VIHKSLGGEVWGGAGDLVMRAKDIKHKEQVYSEAHWKWACDNKTLGQMQAAAPAEDIMWLGSSRTCQQQQRKADSGLQLRLAVLISEAIAHAVLTLTYCGGWMKTGCKEVD